VEKQFSITVFTEFVTGVPLYPEEGGNRFLQNVGLIYRLHCVIFQKTFTIIPPRQSQI